MEPAFYQVLAGGLTGGLVVALINLLSGMFQSKQERSVIAFNHSISQLQKLYALLSERTQLLVNVSLDSANRVKGVDPKNLPRGIFFCLASTHRKSIGAIRRI